MGVAKSKQHQQLLLVPQQEYDEPQSPFSVTASLSPHIPSRTEKLLKRLSLDPFSGKAERILSSSPPTSSPTKERRNSFSPLHSNISIFDYPDETVTVLLVGCGGSGKSTIFKQTSILYDSSLFSDQTFQKDWSSIIRANCLKAVVQLALLCDYDPSAKTIKVEEQNKELALKMAQLRDDVYLKISKLWTDEFADEILKIWEDEYIQQAYREKRNMIQIPENTDYNFKYFNIIRQENYLPSQDDIVMNSSKTTGYVSRVFRLTDSLGVKLIDTGGQRNERKKWGRIYEKEKLNFILFVVSLSEYNEVLYEDESTNRLEESLTLFSSIMNTPAIADIPLILILNKVDTFEQKLTERNDLHKFFPEYQGGTDVKAGIQFIRNLFFTFIPEDKTVYTYETSVSQTQNVDQIFMDLLQKHENVI